MTYLLSNASHATKINIYCSFQILSLADTPTRLYLNLGFVLMVFVIYFSFYKLF